MNYSQCGFGREVRVMLKESLSLNKQSLLAVGLLVSLVGNPDEVIAIKFGGQTDKQLRAEILNAMIELMTRHSNEEIRFQIRHDFGPLGNAVVNTWALTAYWLTWPTRWLIGSVKPS
jgi:hypothetical protein